MVCVQPSFLCRYNTALSASFEFVSKIGAPWSDELKRCVHYPVHGHSLNTLNSRLRAIILSSDTANLRYNIYAPPEHGFNWQGADGDNNTQRLVIGSQAIRFWVVGEVAKEGAWLIGKGGSPLKSVSMAVYPIRAGEYDKWLSFLDKLGGLRSAYDFLPIVIKSLTLNCFLPQWKSYAKEARLSRVAE